MNGGSPKLIARALSKRYQQAAGQQEVLRDISLTVRNGEFVSIVGASGCGKTTFLRLLNGLVPPTAGSVSVEGVGSGKRQQQMAFVFQQDGLLPWRTVQRNAMLGPELHHRPIGRARALAREVLALVGLNGFAQHYPHQLSGGMRQRVNLARALTFEADILLMDEPFAALDAQTRVIMQAELLRICRETAKTVLFVTHQIDEAVYLSDRVVVFTSRPGRIKEEVAIDLPRPRDLKIKWSPEFVHYTNHIWSSIEEEVRSSMTEEARSARP